MSKTSDWRLYTPLHLPGPTAPIGEFVGRARYPVRTEGGTVRLRTNGRPMIRLGWGVFRWNGQLNGTWTRQRARAEARRIAKSRR